MSFDSKKNNYGESLTSGVSIFVNACKYTIDDAFDKRDVTLNAHLNAGYTGVFTIADGDPLFFVSSNPYLKAGDEIIKIKINTATEIEILSRGEFGTTDETHMMPSAQIIHGGEADGTCQGYPKRPDGKGCSTNDSFDRSAEREFLFINGQSYDGQIYYNGLSSISHSPSEIKPGVSMAKNASASITIMDNTDDDVYSVPYPERRTSNATLIKKLLARTGGYLQNRRAITYTGFENNGNFSKEDCVAREYIIDSQSLNKGSWSVKLLDPLMLAEASKTKTPMVSSGRLLNAITSASVSIELKDFIVGEYGQDTDTVTVVIDSELIECKVTDSTTGELEITSREVGGSETKDHSINASVQIVKVLTNFNPIETIIEELQQTSIPAKFYGDYSGAIAATPNATGPVYIYKPDSASKYINLIIRTWAESNIALYFDERAQKIKIKAVGDFEQQPVTLDFSEDIKQESLSSKPQYADQLTRSTIGFAPFNGAKKTDDENASILFESINVLTEATGTLEPQSEDDFYTQFLTNTDQDIQIAIGGAARISNLNTKAPEIFEFKIDYSKFGAVDGGVVEEAEIINVTSDNTVDDYGNPKANNLQILSLKDNPDEATYTVKAITYQDIINESDFDFIVDGDKENYDLSAEFAPPAAGEYTVFIPSGVTIGGTSTLVDAFTTGTQASGVTLKLIIRGGVLGAGGTGPSATDATTTNPNDFPLRIVRPGTNGSQGGNALNLTVDCEIDVSQGIIYSGGGSSPSSVTIADSFNAPYVQGGNGGSGGQGYVGGKKGGGSTATIENLMSDTGLNGMEGTRAAPGELGGLKAGSFGGYSDENNDTGDAGAPGFAIKSNGNDVKIIGDNDLTIKGLRDY